MSAEQASSLTPTHLVDIRRDPGLVNGYVCELAWLREAQPGKLTHITIHKP